MQNQPETTSLYDSIDPDQRNRIESLHRGFLYQHLYAVAVLFIAKKNSVERVIVESDDDLEIIGPGYHIYAQVKTRLDLLQPSHLTTTIERFALLRNEHLSAKRLGKPFFAIITNASVSNSLILETEKWPADTKLLTPLQSALLCIELPVPQKDVASLIELCVSLAGNVPHSQVQPETLVFKLATCILAASAGTSAWPNHTINVDSLHLLFEQVVVQLQTFPERVTKYLLQDGEPAYSSVASCRLITAHSGAGKSAWAAEAAQYLESESVYFDIGDTLQAMLPIVLGRELAAGLFSGSKLNNVLLPGYVGLDALRSISSAIKTANRHVTIFLDNAHRCDTQELIDIISACSGAKWILLAQPHPTLRELCIRLSIEMELLGGWSIETIAKVFHESGLPINLLTAERVRRLTGGAPLFVESMINVIKSTEETLPRELCDELEGLKHVVTSAPEAILSRAFKKLEPNSRVACAVIELSEVPLLAAEARSLVAMALESTEAAAAQALRQAIEWRIVNQRQNGNLSLHDAFRILAKEVLASMPDELCIKLRSRLVDLLSLSLDTHPDVMRQRALLKLLPLAGRTDELIDISTSMTDRLRELGLITDIEPFLSSIAESSETPVKYRIWLYDALAAFAYQRQDDARFDACVEEMLAQSSNCEPDKNLRMAIATKRMIYLGRKRMITEARNELQTALALNDQGIVEELILKYNFAIAVYQAADYDIARQEAQDIVRGYHSYLGITKDDYFFRNPDKIWPRLNKVEDATTICRRLADALSLICLSNQHNGDYNPQVRMQACKFYSMAQAAYSFVECGRNVVDDLLATGYPFEALNYMETYVLPCIEKEKLLECVIPARGHYAYVLARCGQKEKALILLQSLKLMTEMGSSEAQMLTKQEQEIQLLI